MSYADFQREDRRLRILQVLHKDTDYSVNDRMLQTALDKCYGHGVSMDVLRSDLSWLKEQGLLAVSGDEIQVATLSERGCDVVLGRARVPGVNRPDPRA